MKKNILTILLLSMTLAPLAQMPLRAQVATTTARLEEQNMSDDDFDDFFGEPTAESVAPKKRKKKWSRLQLFMVQLGVAVALRAQSFCQWLSAVWAYLTSWVIREKEGA